MKKLFTTFTAVLCLAVLFIVPASASDDCGYGFHYFENDTTCHFCGFECIHDFTPHGPDGHFCAACGCMGWCLYEDYACIICGQACYHCFDNPDGVCDWCGWRCSHDQYVDGRCAVCDLPDFKVYACDHISLSNCVLFVGPDHLHYFGCPDCSWSASFVDVFDLLYNYPSGLVNPEFYEPHQYSGECFCSWYGGISSQSQFLGLYCRHVVEDGFPIYACTDGHYIACEECRYYRPFEDFAVSLNLVSPGSDEGHSPGGFDRMCVVISSFVSEGGIEGNLVETNVPSSEYFSSSVLSSVTDIVTAAVVWISAFVLCIVSNPLLLIFVVSIFVILGLYLIKRTIHL